MKPRLRVVEALLVPLLLLLLLACAGLSGCDSAPAAGLAPAPTGAGAGGPAWQLDDDEAQTVRALDGQPLGEVVIELGSIFDAHAGTIDRKQFAHALDARFALECHELCQIQEKP